MTTTEENIAQVGAIFEAFGRGDVSFILDRLTDSARFVSHLAPQVPWAGEFAGRERVTGYFQAMGATIDVLEHPVTSITAQDNRVVATGDVTFRVRETDTIGSSSWVYIFTLDGDRLTRFEQFNDMGLAQAFASTGSAS